MGFFLHTIQQAKAFHNYYLCSLPHGEYKCHDIRCQGGGKCQIGKTSYTFLLHRGHDKKNQNEFLWAEQ